MGRICATKFTLLMILARSSAAFQLVSQTKTQDLEQGQTLRLTCQADSAYEYCSWRHGERDCQLEWKYKQDKVIVTECHNDLLHRMTVDGNYASHECGITVTNISVEDAGDWECELEEYVLGWSRGTKRKQQIKVTVAAVTTTRPTTASPSTARTTTTTSTTISTATSETEIETTTFIENLSIKYDDDDVEFESQPNSTSTESLGLRDGKEREVEIEALPVTEAEEAEDGSSVGLIAGVIVSLLAMALVLTAIGVTWHRRRKSRQAIISYLQTERDDQMASNAFLEEAEYHISIIRDPQSLPLQQQKTIEIATETDKM